MIIDELDFLNIIIKLHLTEERRKKLIYQDNPLLALLPKKPWQEEVLFDFPIAKGSCLCHYL